MCDEGYNFTFHSKECEIRKVSLGRLVANANRTMRNVYIIDEAKEKKCCRQYLVMS